MHRFAAEGQGQHPRLPVVWLVVIAKENVLGFERALRRADVVVLNNHLLEDAERAGSVIGRLRREASDDRRSARRALAQPDIAFKVMSQEFATLAVVLELGLREVR